MSKKIFWKIWFRVAAPILAVAVVALYLFMNLFLTSVELLQGGHRVEQIGSELALILAGQELADKESLMDRLLQFHMVGILFDRNGREAARSDFRGCTEDMELLSRYQEMEETLLEAHAGKGIPVNQVHVFDDNYWYGTKPVWTKDGEYVLYYSGVTATWHRNGDKLLSMAAAVFLAVLALTFCIAASYYRLHKKQQAAEAAHNRKVIELAHNLKTPMMVISGYSENFLAEVQTQKSTHYAQMILENVNKMNDIVEEMLLLEHG